MPKKTIVTISREFGSGGRDVGKKLAEQLNIPFYDKELIEIAARESGIDKELFEEDVLGASKKMRLLGVLGNSLGGTLSTISELSLNDRMFIVQTNVIETLAQQGPCVIVGRSADYILRSYSNVLNVYIYSDLKSRKERAKQAYGIADRDIESAIRKVDKHRANYYGFYTDREWGRAENYDISMSTSTFGIDGSVEIIRSLLQIDK